MFGEFGFGVEDFWTDEAVKAGGSVCLGVFHQVARDGGVLLIMEYGITHWTLEDAPVQHRRLRVRLLRVLHDSLLTAEGDWTFGALEKLDQTVVVHVSAQILGMREHFATYL